MACTESIDKTGWKDGPWMTEPDYKHWVDEQTDLDCLIVRVEGLGHLCGYVGVPEGHPWYRVKYDEIPGGDFGCHGGLTRTELCEGRVCHDVPGRPEPVWWLGFDHAHAGDHSPGEESILGWVPNGGTYRDVPYVEAGCRALCAAADAAKQTA